LHAVGHVASVSNPNTGIIISIRTEEIIYQTEEVIYKLVKYNFLFPDADDDPRIWDCLHDQMYVKKKLFKLSPYMFENAVFDI